MTYETILVSVDAENIATLTFNRPKVRNALNAAMVREIRMALETLAAQSIRALIFCGAGDKAFLGGADISEMVGRTREDALRFINNGLFRDIEQFPQPTIAAITGFALGGGVELALSCDMRICGEGARLGQPEVSLGIIPGAGATYRLARTVGQGHARELIFSGRIIDATEALRIGLVQHKVQDELVLSTAHALARDIAKNSALAVRMAKLVMNAVAESSVDAAMTLEATAQAVLFEDEEKHQRMTAFLQHMRR